MLVLSRKVGERIIIGGAIVVEVTKIAGDKVWLGTTAPAEVGVNREEIQRRIDDEQSPRAAG